MLAMKTTTKPYLLLLYVSLILSSVFILSSCEGPAGSQGPQGEDGQDGQEGPQGQAGPGARIINFTLQDHLEEAKINAGAIINSPETDTGSFEWAAVFDTTLTQVAIADSEVVFIYANLPGVGFSQLPLSIDYSGDEQINNFSDEPSNYSYSQQSFNMDAFALSPPATLFGDLSTSVYGTLIGSFLNPSGILTFAVNENGTKLDARATITSQLGLSANTEYLQVLVNDNNGEIIRFPLDSDISNAELDEYIMTDVNGEFIYEGATDQLASLKDTLGIDLNDIFGLFWGLFTADSDSLVGSISLIKNPIFRNVQLYSQWNSDSIHVTGYMEGVNLGNDPTAYINNFPVDIRIVIVSGNPVSKRRTRIPYDELMQLIQ
jgi:hypothetical protein